MLGNLNTAYRSRSLADDPKMQVDVSNNDFKKWQNDHMYRTSTRDMSKRTPQKSKKYAIPGYHGHIPGTGADTNYGKGFTQVSRQQHNRNRFLPDRVTEQFPTKPQAATLMGKTLGNFGGGLQDEYHVVTRRYGGVTIPKTHPNYSEHNWQSSYTAQHYDRETDRGRTLHRTGASWKSATVSARPSTMASGFVQNSTLFDGTTWVPDKQLGGGKMHSEYRARHNPEVPFHPKPLKANERKMKTREANYPYE